MTRLSSGLPKDPQKNGLGAIAGALLNNPHHKHLVIALVDCSKITEDTDTGERQPTIRILRIERVAPEDQDEAERLVRRALEYRSGDTVLPLDIERDLESWFGKGVEVDVTTGELTLPADPDAVDDDGGDES